MTTNLTFTALLLAVAASIAGGCANHAPALEQDRYGSANETMIRTVFDQQVRNGIIAERTVYPYHFRTQSHELNELGERQLEVLATAFRTAPGELNLSRGEEPEELYDARVQTVHETLARHGVEPGSVAVLESIPGGRGMRSRDAADALQRHRQPRRTGTGAQTTTGGR